MRLGNDMALTQRAIKD